MIESREGDRPQLQTISDTIKGSGNIGPFRFDTITGYRYGIIQEAEDGPNFSFPYIRCEGCETIANAINRDLMRDLLEIDPSDVSDNIFEYVGGSVDDPNSGLYDLSYSVDQANETTLSLSIEVDWCAAYCETFERYNVYDTRSGARVRVTDLFEGEDLEYIINQNADWKKGMIVEYLKELQDQLEGQKLNEDEAREIQEKIEMYARCLEGDSWWRDTKDLEYYEFNLQNDSIIFHLGRCSSHAEIPLDDLWEFDLGYSISELYSHLTPYGKELLSPETR